MNRLFLILALAALPTITPAFVANYNQDGRVLRWNIVSQDNRVSPNVVNPDTGAVRYFLGTDTLPEANRQSLITAVRACFGQWESVPGTALRFEEGGLLPGPLDLNPQDNTNLVYWTKQRLIYGGLVDITGVTALTFFDRSSDNTLLESDIVLNGVDFNWFTDATTPDPNAYFVEAVLLHEIGHFIGLDHSPVGGATMMARGTRGFSSQAGLSSDDRCAIVSLYPKDNVLASLATVRGKVLRGRSTTPGAVVLVEDEHGNCIAGTVSAPDGQYQLPALPPIPLFVRATPLDPNSNNSRDFLIRGVDIDQEYAAAEVNFLPNTPELISPTPGAALEKQVNVTSGSQPFHITRIGQPGRYAGFFNSVNAAVQIKPGTTGLYIGVSSPNLPTSGATLAVTGTGITLGPPLFSTTASGMNVISAAITVAPDASPGLRSLIVRRGTDTAYANGFLDVLPLIPDNNFDGLDDQFQRFHFAPFTQAEAAPYADPDSDGFNNQHEFNTGTNPTDQLSLKFRILSVKLTTQGTTVTFESGPGKSYQLYAKNSVDTDWIAVSQPFATRNTVTAVSDPNAMGQLRFYKIEAILP